MALSFQGLGQEGGVIDDASVTERIRFHGVLLVAFQTADGHRCIIGVDDFELTVALTTGAIANIYFQSEPPKKP
jgi:hypothetical protein